ncbi:MAG TPA: CdaR family protein [Spirochaetales bacterium]|nr:CdaR family protein [Spirochaetales bacterium]HRY56200.1 CdaR family protein [Spirochaetia bacterium]HRZ64038.1 CdaR family protein [Spirochaetia bacterium]
MRNRRPLERLTRDWPAKILSLAAALLLFFFYRLNRLEDRYLAVPLEVAQGEEYSPSSQLPRSVRIVLRGESNAIFSIQEGDVRASLDLSGYRSEGVYRAAVRIEKRGSALGVDPLEIKAEPSEVAVGIERRVSRVVPVTPSFRGFLEPGFELASFEIQPAEVEIDGPASAVGRVADVATDFVELSGRSADFSVKVKLVKKDALVSFAGIDQAEFRAVVRKSLATRTFDRLPILPVGLDPALELAEPLPAGSIRIRSAGGAAAAAADFTPTPGALSVDLSSARKPGTYVLPVLAVLPDGYAVERYEPQELAVQLVPKGEAR